MHRMLKAMALGLVALAPISTTLAASKSSKLTRCDGKQRRPANLYGSILPTVDPAGGTVSPATGARGGVDVFREADPAKPNPRKSDGGPPVKPPPQIPPISSIAPPTSIRSC